VRRLRLILGPKGDGSDDYEALPREESLVEARKMLDRLYGMGGSPDVPPDRCDVHRRFAYGLCDECNRKAIARFRWGAFALCRDCLRQRRNVARLVGEGPSTPPGSLDLDLLRRLWAADDEKGDAA
jgi:hypothetical protein